MVTPMARWSMTQPRCEAEPTPAEPKFMPA
jgi:hypothetical protein